jgi:hypothetical protein
VVGHEAEAGDGAAHRQDGGVVDVDRVDLPDRGGAESDRQGALADPRGEALAQLGGQRLGVVDSANRPGVRWHDHRACDDGARERAPSDFIHSGEERSPGAPKLLLDPAPACAVPTHGPTRRPTWRRQRWSAARSSSSP